MKKTEIKKTEIKKTEMKIETKKPEMKKTEMQDLCREYGLKVSGNKAELAERLANCSTESVVQYSQTEKRVQPSRAKNVDQEVEILTETIQRTRISTKRPPKK